MSEAPDPLEPGLDALLEAERQARAPEATLDRVWSQVESSVALSGPGGLRGKTPLRTGEGARWLAPHTGVLVAAAFVVGGATGAGATLLLRKPAERIVYIDRPVAVATTIASGGLAPPVVALPAVTAAPPLPARPSAPSASPAPSSASSLPAERAILDSARNALAQNDGARAIELTDEHARRYAHPQLREEREAIAIQAMVLEGRYGEARERARRFRVASPDSLFLPVVEASLASIP